VHDFIEKYKLDVKYMITSESWASVYSASKLAQDEYPDLDVTIRWAISIAHRVQDPLAELTKIDPKSIGVGQYQHDVNQSALKKGLEAVVESCVNNVGVDVNTASTSLLSFVSSTSNYSSAGWLYYKKLINFKAYSKWPDISIGYLRETKTIEWIRVGSTCLFVFLIFYMNIIYALILFLHTIHLTSITL
jgi:transcriptional accessory protein Tex/SPT6